MASFFDRLGCYLLDVLLIFAISSVISVFIPSKGSDINKEITALTEKYTNGEVGSEAFINEYQDLMYNYQKDNYLSTVVSVGLNFIYFVVFAYFNKGQTIAKKLTNIKVVDNKTGERPKFWQMLVRNIFIYSLLSNIIILILLFTSKNNFIYCYTLVGGFDLMFVMITVMFVLYRKDKRGLHDMMACTKVVKESV